MKEILNSVAINFIEGLFNGALEEKIDYLKKYSKNFEIKENAQAIIRDFLEKNDGTILTSSDFANYLKNYKVIEEMFDCILNVNHNYCGKTELVEQNFRNYKRIMTEKGRTIPANEENLVREFFETVADFFVTAGEQQSTLGERLIQIKLRDVERQAAAVSEENVAQIIDLLNKPTTLSHSEENKIFDALYIWFCRGELSEIKELTPLFEGKSKNISIAIEELFVLISRDNISEGCIVDKIKTIKNDHIRKLCVNFTLAYGFLWPKVVAEISQMMKESPVAEIAEDLCNGAWEKYIQFDNHEERSQLSIISNEYLAHEEWLKVRIVFWYLNSVKSRPPIQIDIKNLCEPVSIIDNWLLAQEFVFLCVVQNQIPKLLPVKQKLLSQLEKSGMVRIELKKLCWKTLLTTCILIEDSETVLNLWNQIPQYLRNDIELKKSWLLAKIHEDKANIDELLSFSIDIHAADLLVIYCMRKNDEEVVEIYDKWGALFPKDFYFFELYIRSYVKLHSQRDVDDSVKSIVINKESDFRKWIDYWILREDLDIEMDFKKIATEICNESMIATIDSIIQFCQKLLNHRFFDEAELISEKFEKRASDKSSYMFLKAQIMLHKKRQIEALDILQSIKDEYSDSPYVIENILSLSLLNKRSISPQVIRYAEKIDTAKAWALLAEYYAENNQKESAMDAITKALLRSKSDDVLIASHYFRLHVQFCGEDECRSASRIEKDTCAQLYNLNKKESIYVCIYANSIRPNQDDVNQHFKWGGAVHITDEEALEMGLCFQKIGDEIRINEETYIVEKITPVDHFLFSKAREKSKENNMIYEIEIPKCEDGSIDFDAFLKQVRSYCPQNEKLLECYENIEEIPPSLFLLSETRNASYTQFLKVLYQDTSLIVRSMPNGISELKNNEEYILSLPVVIFLLHSGLGDIVFKQSNVYVPESLKRFVKDEYMATELQKSKKVVASFLLWEEKPVVIEEDDSFKRRWIRDAYANYLSCKQMKGIENSHSVELLGYENIKLQEVIGVCDYDAVAIAHYQEKTLVAFEPIVIALSTKGMLDFRCIGIIDLLCEIELPLDQIIAILSKMAEYKFEFLLSEQNWLYLIDKFDSIYDDEYREKCMCSWFDFLETVDAMKTGDKYKTVFWENLVVTLRRYYLEEVASEKAEMTTISPLVKVAAFFYQNQEQEHDK